MANPDNDNYIIISKLRLNCEECEDKIREFHREISFLQDFYDNVLHLKNKSLDYQYDKANLCKKTEAEIDGDGVKKILNDAYIHYSNYSEIEDLYNSLLNQINRDIVSYQDSIAEYQGKICELESQIEEKKREDIKNG